jgi:hypothetical protein
MLQIPAIEAGKICTIQKTTISKSMNFLIFWVLVTIKTVKYHSSCHIKHLFNFSYSALQTKLSVSHPTMRIIK